MNYPHMTLQRDVLSGEINKAVQKWVSYKSEVYGLDKRGGLCIADEPLFYCKSVLAQGNRFSWMVVSALTDISVI